jgi:hypothetical protein
MQRNLPPFLLVDSQQSWRTHPKDELPVLAGKYSEDYFPWLKDVSRLTSNPISLFDPCFFFPILAPRYQQQEQNEKNGNGYEDGSRHHTRTAHPRRASALRN